jgi:hypothetical protein
MNEIAIQSQYHDVTEMRFKAFNCRVKLRISRRSLISRGCNQGLVSGDLFGDSGRAFVHIFLSVFAYAKHIPDSL